VQRVEIASLLRVDIRVGSRLSLHNSAMGWVLLSDLAPERTSELMDALGLESSERARTLEAVARAARDGYAVGYDAPYPGISAIAAPIRDAAGSVIAALGVAGPSARFDPLSAREATVRAAASLPKGPVTA
jgi:DNA-binding IclR family transcriptional regulator